MPGQLTDCIALITGAGRGIGRALALGFAEEGAHVILVGRTPAPLEAVAAEIASRGGRATTHPADVSSEPDVAALAERLEREHGRLHVLVNNAAVRMNHIGDPNTYEAAVLDLAIEEWDRMMAVNLRGPFLTCKLLGPLLHQSGGASIINISSRGAVEGPMANRASYGASKAGLEVLTKALAGEWKPYNVAANTLYPEIAVLTDEIKIGMRRNARNVRYVRPEVMVPAALWLAQQDGSGVSGERIGAVQWAEEHGLGDWTHWEAGNDTPV